MITLDLDFYWVAVGAVCIMLGGQWAFRQVRRLFSR